MGGWSGYHHHHQLHHHNQHYSHSYNNHSHHSSMHSAGSYSQGSGMGVGAGLGNSSLSPGRNSRVDSRMSSLESSMTSRLNPSHAPSHHIALRSPVKPQSDSPSPVSFPQASISIPEPIKSQQHQPTATVGYFGQMYGSSTPNTSYYMPSQLGQLSPPPETSPSSCSSSSIPPSTFPPSLHLEPSNPESSGHLGSSSAEFWSEVDRHEFDQYVNVGRNREEAYGRCGGGSKVVNGRSSTNIGSGGMSNILNNSGCDESSSPLISALSDASSAVYYSTCITG